MSFARVSVASYFATSSVTASLPSSASKRTAAHVNCFVTEPMPNAVSASTSAPLARSALP